MASELPVLLPDWPAPECVRAACTTRVGGISRKPWDSLNLGVHVGDNPDHVAVNRQRLADRLGLGTEAFGWLAQIHGTCVVELPVAGVPSADASTTRCPGQVCAILTADCLPVLFCNRDGTQVAAAHAGWRGLCAGVLEATIHSFESPADEILAWLGPAIGPTGFEVGPEVMEEFVSRDLDAVSAFTAEGAGPGHFMADIYQLARQRLQGAGVAAVYGGGECTLSDSERFFSYRRDGNTGRMASLIWLEA